MSFVVSWEEWQRRVIAMRTAGHSLGAIAGRLHLEREEVETILDRHGDPIQRRPVRLVPRRVA